MSKSSVFMYILIIMITLVEGLSELIRQCEVTDAEAQQHIYMLIVFITCLCAL